MVAGPNEEISALVDGELDGARLKLELNRVRLDSDARAAWDTYHLIGDVLRGQEGPDLCAKVASRLAAETTVLAPGGGRWDTRTLGGWAMSAAAAVAAGALVIWTALPNLGSDAQSTQVAANVKGPDSSQMPSAATPVASEVAGYLLAHQRFSSTSAMQGVAPYVRAVADESGARR